MQVLKYAGKILKKADLFGSPVGVNYKGNSSYSTKMGGVFGLLAAALILYFVVGRVQKLMNKDDPSKF